MVVVVVVVVVADNEGMVEVLLVLPVAEVLLVPVVLLVLPVVEVLLVLAAPLYCSDCARPPLCCALPVDRRAQPEPRARHRPWPAAMLPHGSRAKPPTLRVRPRCEVPV